MKPSYLMAYGPNSIEIICMIFESFSTGMKWLKDNTEWTWEFNQSATGGRWAKPIISENYLSESIPAHAKFFSNIFTSWYFGCGECDLVRLIELEEYGKPLAGFDLD